MKTTEAILGCALAMLYKVGFSAVWSNLGTNRKGRGQITWLLDVSVKADTDAFCFLPRLCHCHSLGALSLPVFKGNRHHPPPPGGLGVQKIRNPSWHEMQCEMCLKIKLLMTMAIKKQFFQMHFSWLPGQKELVLY